MSNRETALVFDKEGRTIYWHTPDNRTGGYIPDSRALWLVMWDNRDRLGGVAHTHPWDGEAGYSGIDASTWASCEEALGCRLVWSVVTFTDIQYFAWNGSRYERLSAPPFGVVDVDELRQKSRGE